MAVLDAGRTHGTGPGSIEDLRDAWRPTSPATSRIVKMDLSELELREVRSMLSDQTVTDVYVRTSSYDGEPEALVDVVDVVEVPVEILEAGVEVIVEWGVDDDTTTFPDPELYRRMFPDPLTPRSLGLGIRARRSSGAAWPPRMTGWRDACVADGDRRWEAAHVHRASD